MTQHSEQGELSNPRITRRSLLIKSGVALVGTTLLGFPFELTQTQETTGDLKSRGIMSKNGGMKPTFLPESGSQDPVAHSLAENLFWNEQLMEHATFFVMLMPGPELATQRSQAEQFKNTFASQLQKAKAANLDRSSYVAFNRTSIELVKPFVDFKQKMRDEQAAGKLKSLTWS